MRVAVIGSGISGLAAAWLLDQQHEVHLYELRDRLGGHSHTVTHNEGARQLQLDTGFLVFNNRTYPKLTALFDRLEVATHASDMSFAVSSTRPELEYSGADIGGLLAQPANLLRPGYCRMLLDILRFGRRARQVLGEHPDPDATVEDFLRQGGFGSWFRRFFLLPMTAAIWSSGTEQAADFPRDVLLRFFANHGLLSVTGQPQWRTVSGGSRTYVDALAQPLGDRVHLGLGATRLIRGSRSVEVELSDGSRELFDHAVVATHADQALAMLADPSADERELLGAWTYSRNDVWLHCDSGLMPRRRLAWASWNSLLHDDGETTASASLTYYLNRLQGLDSEHPYLVTLNPPITPRSDAVIRRMAYRHPIYSRTAVATQPDLPRLNGTRCTHFCGAYFGNGFHEDGLASAIRVAEDLGVTF